MSGSNFADVFCPLPWNHASVRTNGQMLACCLVYEPLQKGKDGSGQDYNAGTDTVASARNAPVLRDIRAAMLRGEKPTACNRCWDTERVGALSARQINAEKYPGLMERARQLTRADGTIVHSEFPLQYYDLRLGNLCNLACKMCSPHFSSTWARYAPDPDTRANYTWYVDSPYWRELLDSVGASGAVKQLMITGGEPLMSKHHWELIDQCVAGGRASEISIYYNTNMTVTLTDQMIEKWSKFQQIWVGCSVDGYAHVNEYIRHPAQWRVVERNLDRLDSCEHPNIVGNLSPTISVFNVLYIPEMVRWQVGRKFKKLGVHPGNWILEYPEPMSIQVLPKPVKLAIAKKYEELFAWARETQEASVAKSIHDTYEPVLKWMNAAERQSLLPDLMKTIADLDRKQQTDFRKSLPELWALIEAAEPATSALALR
ncbi:MAG: twitch domain-containing radical SAM protein [Planctomycetes bacterium]|nr:twitch domain-containing radical SAM protein [Planctomycetota bacterium]